MDDHDPADEDRRPMLREDFDLDGLYLCRMNVDAADAIDGDSSEECGAEMRTKHGWCPRHEEEARLNLLVSLGSDARKAIAWRDGDEQRIASRVLGDDVGIRGRRAVEKTVRGRRRKAKP